MILLGEQGAAVACTSSRSSGSRDHNRRLLHRRYRKSVMWPKSLLGPISRSRIHLRQRHPPPIRPHSLFQICSSDTNHLHFRPSNSFWLTLLRTTPPALALPPPPFSGEEGYGDVGMWLQCSKRARHPSHVSRRFAAARSLVHSKAVVEALAEVAAAAQGAGAQPLRSRRRVIRETQTCC